MARAVLPVPGGPANRTARPASRLDLIKSTTKPAAWNISIDFIFKYTIYNSNVIIRLTSLACSWPTSPAAIGIAFPASSRPRPLMWLWAEIRWVLTVLRTSSIFISVLFYDKTGTYRRVNSSSCVHFTLHHELYYLAKRTIKLLWYALPPNLKCKKKEKKIKSNDSSAAAARTRCLVKTLFSLYSPTSRRHHSDSAILIYHYMILLY